MTEVHAELHLHTCYSFLDGASHPEELATTAAALGYGALAITDYDGLYGAMAFAHACRAAGLRSITGVELTLRHGLVDRQALAIARDTSRTLSETVADLMRLGLGHGAPTEIGRSDRTGLPVVRLGTSITSEDVRALDDPA